MAVEIHDPAVCDTCQGFKAAILSGDPLLACVHAFDEDGLCELCLNTKEELGMIPRQYASMWVPHGKRLIFHMPVNVVGGGKRGEVHVYPSQAGEQSVIGVDLRELRYEWAPPIEGQEEPA